MIWMVVEILVKILMMMAMMSSTFEMIVQMVTWTGFQHLPRTMTKMVAKIWVRTKTTMMMVSVMMS